MMFRKLLIANRGEIAIRIARAAASVGLPCAAVYSEDDRDALHPLRADEAVPLPGTGPRAYLDGEAILAAARAVGADALHPGYAFLSEHAAFARRCAEAGVQFIGPAPRVLD
ncbi:MAG: biotin carboxylase N-terminal domain-containing protein, partial [Ralstonia mannitolilytica]